MVETSTHKIKLNQYEDKLFTTLMEIVKQNELKTTLRVAGGWVRDKLMGLESDDIDIALDDMYGEEFAKLIDQKVNQDQAKGHFGVIKANCEKSKHLETATIRVFGEMIDLVNLRSEKYSEDSRVPTIEIGTPEEDAFRRDLTINSLFYNINTQEVEDWTKMGLQDLKDQVIRTPMEPLQTFLDDPLRILRTIRFANRFGFKIEPSIITAAHNPTVRLSLLEKVSYERLGIELDKMFEGRCPEVAVQQLHQFEILQLLYKLPQEFQDAHKEEEIKALIQQSVDLCNVIGQLFKGFKEQQMPVSFAGRSIFEKQSDLASMQMRCFYTALLLPFHQFSVPQGKKKQLQPLTQFILNNSLKKSNEVQKFVIDTSRMVEQNIEFAGLKPEQINTLKFGWYLREAGHRWTPLQILAAAKMAQSAPLEDCIVRQKMLNEVMEELKLTQIHTVKTLVDGKQICDMYGIKPGKMLKPLIDEMMSFQIENPSADKEDAKVYLQGKKDEFLAKYT